MVRRRFGFSFFFRLCIMVKAWKKSSRGREGGYKQVIRPFLTPSCYIHTLHLFRWESARWNMLVSNSALRAFIDWTRFLGPSLAWVHRASDPPHELWGLLVVSRGHYYWSHMPIHTKSYFWYPNPRSTQRFCSMTIFPKIPQFLQCLARNSPHIWAAGTGFVPAFH